MSSIDVVELLIKACKNRLSVSYIGSMLKKGLTLHYIAYEKCIVLAKTIFVKLDIVFLSINCSFDVKISGKRRQGRSVMACGLRQIQRSHGTGERIIGVSRQLTLSKLISV